MFRVGGGRGGEERHSLAEGVSIRYEGRDFWGKGGVVRFSTAGWDGLFCCPDNFFSDEGFSKVYRGVG